MSDTKSNVIVQKFGGSSLARPEQILSIAKRIAERHRKGNKIVVVVSAMGKTTDQLIELARQVSPVPNRRELDMLLTTGERVSMALLSMALHDLNCPSISFTGSQAGVMTDGAFSNARIVDIKPHRVEAALQENKIVVIAGFQGVDPNTKEITTLGRGGSDTTAVALAAHFDAKSCEILKDVDGVFTADPKIVATAKPLKQIDAKSLMEMTFWGAKVLHHRSVELAARRQVPLFIGRADNFEIGTHIKTESKQKEQSMFEQNQILGVNSHKEVHHATFEASGTDEGFQLFRGILEAASLPWPQVLASTHERDSLRIMYTGDSETLSAIQNTMRSNKKVQVGQTLSSATVTCYGGVASSIVADLCHRLKSANISVFKTILSPQSLSFFVNPDDRERTIQILHG